MTPAAGPALGPRGLDIVAQALAGYPGERLSFLVGDPCFAPPKELTDALAAAAAEGHHRYTSNQGTPAVRDAVRRWHEREGEIVSAEQVFVTHGAKVAALVLLGTLLRAGDDVVVPTPYYAPYRSLPARLGANVVPVPRRPPGFGFDVEELARAVTAATRAVLFASPCNPTGATLTSDQARGIVDLARSRGIRLICDETYAAFRFAPDAVSSLHALDPGGTTVCRVRSFSKTFAVCGWRLGYIIADVDLVRALTHFQAAHVNPPNAVVQRALESCPTVPPGYHERTRETVARRIESLRRTLADVGFAAPPPAGGFYLFVDAREAMRATGHATATEFCRALAAEEGVGFVPGSDFGADGWARVSAVSLLEGGFDEKMAVLARRLDEFVRSRPAR